MTFIIIIIKSMCVKFHSYLSNRNRESIGKNLAHICGLINRFYCVLVLDLEQL